MRTNYHHWRPEEDEFIRKHWPTAVNTEYFTKRFNNKFGTNISYSKIYDRVRRMKLSKSASAIKKQRDLYVGVCLEKRGPDFNTRMRARALSGLYFGGKHFTWKGMKREDSAKIAKNITPEARARAHETRRKTIKKERLRLSWGMEQRTNLHLDKMPSWESWARYNLRSKYGYRVFRFDRSIYYDADTTRSSSTEAHYEGRGLTFLPIQERESSINE